LAPRLSVVERAALIASVGLWGVCLTLSIRTALLDIEFAGVFVSGASGPDEFPRFTSFRTYVNAEDSPLRSGDRLLKIGESELRGVGSFGFIAESLETSRRDLPQTLTFERDGKTANVIVPTIHIRRFIWPVVPASSRATGLHGPGSTGST